MSNAWLFRPTGASADVAWEWLDASTPDGVVRCGSIDELAAALAGAARRQSLVLLLPAGEVLAAPVNVPARQQRQLLQALPFLIEENLAGDIERLHVVPGRRINGERLQVLAVDRHYLKGLLDALGAAGIDPDIVASEALALAVPAQGATWLLDGEESLLAGADGTVVPFAAADAAVLAESVASGRFARLRLLSGGADDSLAIGNLESALGAADAPVNLEVVEGSRHRLAWIAADDVNLAAVNFRQGSFARTGGHTLSLGFDWRPLAWLAACWAVLAIGYQVALGITQARAASALQQVQADLYRSVFPGAGNVPRPRAQMEGQLRSGAASGASFVGLLARTADTFTALDKTGTSYRPRNINWDSAHAQLRIDIVARNLDDLDRLRQALEQAGLTVDLGAGVAQEDGYKARMNITAAAREGA